MNPQLQQLKDIHLPQTIHMWPTAPGWITLWITLFILICYLSFVAYQRFQRKKAVKFALAQLSQLKNTAPDNINIAAELSTLIRRTALHYFGREKIAGLTGDAWLNFLNESGNTTAFTDPTGRILIDAPYRNTSSTDLTPLFTVTQAWLMSILKSNGLPAEK